MTSAPDDEMLQSAKPAFLRRVRIRGYKSIAFCDVALEPLTILVGRNASGKSNFLDALAFLRDAVKLNLAEAVNRRGGMKSLLCQTVGSDRFVIEVESIHHGGSLAQDYSLVYRLEISQSADGSASKPDESFRMTRLSDGKVIGIDAQQGSARWSGMPGLVFPQGEVILYPADHVILTTFVHPSTTHLAHGFQGMGFYNFSPEIMREPQKPTPGAFLEREGRNLPSVIGATRATDAWAVERVKRYLRAITRSVDFVDVDQVGGYETLRFRVLRGEQSHPMEFPAASMSDGTLRAFASLMAAFQTVRPQGAPSLVGIEEPETALHPAAMRALVAALDEATLRTQLLLTTHSPDLLDAAEVKPENVRVVQLVDGQTVVGPVDEASVSIVRDHLSTLGGLERERQLEPDIDDLDRQAQLAQQERNHS